MAKKKEDSKHEKNAQIKINIKYPGGTSEVKSKISLDQWEKISSILNS